MKCIAVAIAVVLLASSSLLAAGSSNRHNVLFMDAGRVVGSEGQTDFRAAKADVNPKLLVFTDKKMYMPGETVTLKMQTLGQSPELFQVTINQMDYNTHGELVRWESGICECGGLNGGFIHSLGTFGFITLMQKKLPSYVSGRIDFDVIVRQSTGNNNSDYIMTEIQTTRISIYVGSTDERENAPIVIDTMQKVGNASNETIILTGTFPKGVPLYYYVGAAPFYGAFVVDPTIVSHDGVTLQVPAITRSRVESRIILMTPDASYATVSPESFMPTLAQ